MLVRPPRRAFFCNWAQTLCLIGPILCLFGHATRVRPVATRVRPVAKAMVALEPGELMQPLDIEQEKQNSPEDP